MNYTELVKNLKLANNILGVFQKYAKNLDEYFKIEQNKKEHQELYNYYLKLKEALQIEAKGFIK